MLPKQSKIKEEHYQAAEGNEFCFCISLINETLSEQVSFERKGGWGKIITQPSVTGLAQRSKAIFQRLPFKEKYFIHTGFTPSQPKHLLHQ